MWLRSYDAALPTVRRAHDDDDVRGWVRDVVLPAGEVTVAELDGEAVAVLAQSAGWVDQLYVDPGAQGRASGPPPPAGAASSRTGCSCGRSR